MIQTGAPLYEESSRKQWVRGQRREQRRKKKEAGVGFVVEDGRNQTNKKKSPSGMHSQKIEVSVYSLFLIFRFLLGSLQACVFCVRSKRRWRSVFRPLILPANQAGGVQKERMDNGGSNLCFIVVVVVVVIVWGIILGNMRERESLFNASFSDMRTVSHDDNSDDPKRPVQPDLPGFRLYRSDRRNRERRRCLQPSGNSTGLALPPCDCGAVLFSRRNEKQKRVLGIPWDPNSSLLLCHASPVSPLPFSRAVFSL